MKQEVLASPASQIPLRDKSSMLADSLLLSGGKVQTENAHGPTPEDDAGPRSKILADDPKAIDKELARFNGIIHGPKSLEETLENPPESA